MHGLMLLSPVLQILQVYNVTWALPLFSSALAALVIEQLKASGQLTENTDTVSHDH